MRAGEKCPDDRAGAGAAVLFQFHADHQRRGAVDLRALRRGGAGNRRPQKRADPHRGSADGGGQSGQHADPGGQSPESLSLFVLQPQLRGISEVDAAGLAAVAGADHPGLLSALASAADAAAGRGTGF